MRHYIVAQPPKGAGLYGQIRLCDTRVTVKVGFR